MPSPSITITGNLETIFGGQANGGSAVFTLAGFPQSTPPVVAGSGVLVQITTVATAPAGSFSTLIWGNDVISPANTYYLVDFFAGNGTKLQTAMYSLTGSGTFDISTLTPINPVAPSAPIPGNAVITNPTATQTIVGQPLTVTSTITGNNVTATGTVTAATGTITGNETVGGTLGVTGASTLSGGATVTNGLKSDAFLPTTRGDRQVIVQNPDFEGSSLIPPPGWTVLGSATLTYETISPAPNKLQSLKAATLAAGAGMVYGAKFSVVPGEQYALTASLKADGTSTAIAFLWAVDKNGGGIGNLGVLSNSATSWATSTVIGTVPAGAVALQIFFENTTATPSSVWLDGVSVQRVSFGAFNGDVWVGSGSNQFPSIASAYAAIVAGQAVHVSPNWSETFSANLVLNKNGSGIIFHGGATILMNGFSVTMPGGTNGAYIINHGNAALGGNAVPSFWYGGNSVAFNIGDTSSEVVRLFFQGFNVILKSAPAGSNAGASAVAMHWQQVVESKMERVATAPQASGHIGFRMDGTNTFCGDNHFDTCQLTCSVAGSTGIKLQNQTVNNVFTAIDCDGGGGTALDMATGNVSNNLFNMLDMEGNGTAIQLGTTTNCVNNTFHNLWFEGNTTDIAWSTSQNNYIQGFTGIASAYPVQTDGGSFGNIFELSKSRVLNLQGGTTTLTGNGAAQTVYTFTVPAYALNVSRGLRIRWAITHTTGTAAITYQTTGGGQVLQSNNGDGLNGSTPVADLFVYNTSYTTQSSGGVWYDGGSANSGNIVSFSNSKTITTTAGWTVTVTFNVAATDQVTGKFFVVEFI